MVYKELRGVFSVLITPMTDDFKVDEKGLRSNIDWQISKGIAGLCVTGSTGEDYAISFENAIVTETDDPDEIVGYLLYMRRHPEEQERIRCAGRRTAEQFLWDQVIENLVSKLEFLARKQAIVLT